jgi:hypothetical protein
MPVLCSQRPAWRSSHMTFITLKCDDQHGTISQVLYEPRASREICFDSPNICTGKQKPGLLLLILCTVFVQKLVNSKSSLFPSHPLSLPQRRQCTLPNGLPTLLTLKQALFLASLCLALECLGVPIQAFCTLRLTMERDHSKLTLPSGPTASPDTYTGSLNLLPFMTLV